LLCSGRGECLFTEWVVGIDSVAVNFRDDGSSEVQLGETRVMGHVTAQLVPPYRDRPNEGTLAIFTEFSPMADPAFEPGRPGESAIELGRIIDRGLRSPGSSLFVSSTNFKCEV
jgi:exosome complex RNA-binding protein Rrp42 (RNase PH superfamily)